MYLLSYLFSVLISAFCAAVFTVPLIFILKNKLFKNLSAKRTTVMILFALYIPAVFSVVGFPEIYYITVDFTHNLVPLRGILSYPREPILNIIMFMPFGFLLAVGWARYRSLKNIALAGFCFSLFIELSQILTYRATDVNDLITNTIGCVLGFAVSAIINPMVKNRLYIYDKSDAYEPLYIIIITAAAAFLISPIISI